MSYRLPAALLLIAATLAPATAQEAPRLEGVILGEGISPIKIAVPLVLTGRSEDLNAAEMIETLRQDLKYSGFFDLIDPKLYTLVPTTRDGSVPHEEWLSIDADFVVQVRAQLRDGRIDMEARLYDNSGKGSLQFGRRYGGSPEIVRRVSHQLADDLVRHFTGRPGVALTNIAFVSKHGEGKEVYLMDYDGKRVRRLTSSNTINLSPVWSPDGDELAFVSWRGRQPGVYLMSSEGQLRNLTTVGGELSSAPDWSPDGRGLAYSSDVDGNTEIYLLNRDSRRSRRLTHNPAIDTSPAVSPNGREIAFTSDRAGSPQIYIMDAEGLNVRRLSWSGSYSDSAAWSPRGDLLAYSSRIDGRFQVLIMDISSGKVRQLTRLGNNENPDWSPDGRHLVFASDRAGSYDIYTMRIDGTTARRLTRGGDSFTPDWSR